MGLWKNVQLYLNKQGSHYVARCTIVYVSYGELGTVFFFSFTGYGVWGVACLNIKVFRFCFFANVAEGKRCDSKLTRGKTFNGANCKFPI